MITPYDGHLIKKLRKVYYGGIPASVILISDGMTNGHCYDRALLMSRAFLDDEDSVKLIYADIDSLKLNPKFISDSPLYADHCIVERMIIYVSSFLKAVAFNKSLELFLYYLNYLYDIMIKMLINYVCWR